MCGRTALSAPPDDLREIFQLDEAPVLTPRYNIAPTQPIAIIRVPRDGEPRKIELVRWGLIPFWADDARGASKRINARIESLATTPAFRDAFKRHRCLVVVDAYYEWKKQGKTSPSAPFVVRRIDKRPFALAGIWDRWRSKDGEVVESAAVVTMPAAGKITAVHDRMPLVLSRDDYGAWLGEDADVLAGHFPKPAPLEEMSLDAVGPRVNSPANDDAACLEPPAQKGLFGG